MALSPPKRRSFVRARGRFLELAAALTLLAGCSSEYTIGTLPSGSEPAFRPSQMVSTSDVYATDGRALYRLTTSTMTFGDPMALVGCDLNVVEITENEHGEMYAAGFERGKAALYKVDARTGACTVLSKFSTDAPWAIGFLPQSANGAQRLLGELSSGLTLLDATHGTSVLLAPTPVSRRAACDIVVGPDGDAYVSSVVDWTDDSSANLLEQVDPVSGNVKATFVIDPGAVIDGLATWQGALYGFARDGSIQSLSLEAGRVSRVSLPTIHAPKSFTGASSGWLSVTPY